MRPAQQVLIVLDGTPVPGLVLKWRSDRTEAFVTYEVDGRVETAWVKADQVLPEDDARAALPD